MPNKRKPRKPYKPLNFRSLGGNPDPGNSPSSSSSEVEAALLLVENITTEIDQASDEVADKAAHFFEDVRSGAVAIGETIERTKNVTPNQLRALENWLSGVKKWTDKAEEDDYD